MPDTIEDSNVDQLFYDFLNKFYDHSVDNRVRNYLRKIDIRVAIPYSQHETDDEYHKYKFACVLLANNPRILSKIRFDAASVNEVMFKAIVSGGCFETLKYLFEKFPGYPWWAYKASYIAKDCWTFCIRRMPMLEFLISHGFERDVCDMNKEEYMMFDYCDVSIISDLIWDWECTPRTLKWHMKKKYVSYVNSRPFYFNECNKEIDVLL